MRRRSGCTGAGSSMSAGRLFTGSGTFTSGEAGRRGHDHARREARHGLRARHHRPRRLHGGWRYRCAGRDRAHLRRTAHAGGPEVSETRAGQREREGNGRLVVLQPQSRAKARLLPAVERDSIATGHRLHPSRYSYRRALSASGLLTILQARGSNSRMPSNCVATLPSRLNSVNGPA